MINLLNDYNGTCADEILEALTLVKDVKNVGYSTDNYTLEAHNRIRNIIGDENAYIHFLVGGTQTNLTLLSMLRHHEAIISLDTGHIACHETGAIENTGHKVFTVKSNNSKMNPELVEEALNEHSSFHMVKPKLVYISNSTEYGEVYTKKELEDLRKVCDENNLYLFLDGARLSQALVSSYNDLTLKDIHNLCDAFYIGGTKNGLLFGEALIIRNQKLSEDIKYIIKQKGAMLAKGMLLGVQFNTYFKDDLYLKLATHAKKMSLKLQSIFDKYNIESYLKCDTNLVFVYLEKELATYLSDYILFDSDISVGSKQTYRFVTSYNTIESEIDEIDILLKKYFNK